MSTDNLPAVRFGVQEIGEMAKNVARSRLFGMDEPQIFTLMMLCQSKGLHPIQAVERYHVIQGRPAMRADAMLAEFQAHGGVIKWVKMTDTEVEAVFSHPVNAPDGVTSRFSIADAKRAELLKNGMYTKYPQNMMRARVISNGIRLVMPGILSGIYTPEEVSDFEPAPIRREARIAEPPPPDNGTGYGRGQYAAPDDVEAYTLALRGFVEATNAAWLDEWTGEDGAVAEGIGELIRSPQCTGHLLKWGLRTGQLAPVDMTWDHETGKPTERVSVEKAKKYVAILWNRDPEAVSEELESYARAEAANARKAWGEKHGGSEEDADLEATEAGARG